MTAFLDISTAVRDALLAAPALAGGRVTRGRNVPVGADTASAIAVNTARSRATQLDINGDSVQWETTVVVSVYARATPTQDAEAAIDPLVLAVWQRLQGMAAPAGVFGMTLDPSIQWDIDEADSTVATAQMSLRLSHITTGAALAAT